MPGGVEPRGGSFDRQSGWNGQDSGEAEDDVVALAIDVAIYSNETDNARDEKKKQTGETKGRSRCDGQLGSWCCCVDDDGSKWMELPR